MISNAVSLAERTIEIRSISIDGKGLFICPYGAILMTYPHDLFCGLVENYLKVDVKARLVYD